MNKRYRLGEIEEAVSEMEELIGLEDDIAEIDDDFQIVVSGWSVYVESLNLTLRQGIACVWDAEEGLFMPDFDVTIVYEGNIETQEWLYYEQDGLEKKIDSMTEELTNMQNQLKEMQEDTLVNNAKKALSEAQERLGTRCEQIKSQVLEVKAQVKSTAKSIVDEAKAKGRAALYRVSEFLGIKKRLLDIRENVRGAIKTTDKDIAKTALLAKEFREAGQTAANAFRTFADKPEVDYSQKEQKHPITKAVLAPMKAVKKMLVSMKLHLDASIDKLDNLAIDVRMDKEKHMENAKVQEQTEPERAEAERVEAEIVYSPMVAEPQEYQYNADAFEARGVDEVKQEAAHKEVSKVREDKAR